MLDERCCVHYSFSITCLLSVMVDTTPVIAGRVSDGDFIDQDMQFTANESTVVATWAGFDDSESKIKSFRVDVYRTPPGRSVSSSNTAR